MTSPVDASSTATSKSPKWKTLYESIVFWALVSMVFDMVATFFGATPIGPGYVIGMTFVLYSSSLRDKETGKQYRPTEPLRVWWIVPLLLLVFGLKIFFSFSSGKNWVAISTLAQIVVAIVCLFATSRRIARLPIKEDVAKWPLES